VVTFTAYIWLLGHVAPTRVATYAFVNPVVAVFLGWALAGEPLTATTVVATAVIVAAVAVAVSDRSSSSPRRQVVIDSAEPVSPVAERGA
jgi:drug/metabolite transporter (DMT)-like permease